MPHFSRTKTVVIAASCAGIGAVAGIAGAAASPSPTAKSAHDTRYANHGFPGAPGPQGFRRGRFGPPVHADVVVLNRAGTAFITATEDIGTVSSVSGNALTISEGVGNLTYKTVTLTIPSGASVERNGSPAQLSSLKRGDFVHVSQSSDGTFVGAGDRMMRFEHRGHRFGQGPEGPGGPGEPELRGQAGASPTGHARG